jgi:hypothetical protein
MPLNFGQHLVQVKDARARCDAQVLDELLVSRGCNAGLPGAPQIDRHTIRRLVVDSRDDSFARVHCTISLVSGYREFFWCPISDAHITPLVPQLQSRASAIGGHKAEMDVR